MTVETASHPSPDEIAHPLRPLQPALPESSPSPAGSTRHLAAYDRSRLDSGRSLVWRAAWYFTSLLILESGWLPLSRVKVFILRRFGARIGSGVVIKPHVRIKFPWKLSIGADAWIGQDVWIDNLDEVQLEDDVCVSQGAYLCTGSHDHRSREFDLITRPIRVASGAWVGARAIVLQGVTIGAEAVVAAGSVVTRDVDAQTMVAGNPAAVMPTSSAAPRRPR